jgi:Tripartite tricarboxylate transporter TctB family
MSEGGTSARSDLIGGAGWIFFGLAICVGSSRMDRFEAMGATLYTMPGFVPGLFGALLMLLGAALLWRGWRRTHRRHPPAGAGPEERHAASDGTTINRRVAIVLALSLVYAAVLVGRTPFWLATVLYVTAFTWLFAQADRGAVRRALVALVTGVVTTAVVVLVFEQVFLVRLP